MPKEFPIRLMVEEIALGTVLRKLHDMPGIVKLDLDFGHGGQGAGKDKLQQAAAAMNMSPEEAVLKALANGPMKSRDLINATGMKDHRVYYALNKLGLKRNNEGEYQLAEPKKKKPTIKRGPAGRAAPGSGPATLRTVLAAVDGPLATKDLRVELAKHGMSPKSISGVMDRARRDGIIKTSGDGYVLTAKAEKMNGEAHG